MPKSTDMYNMLLSCPSDVSEFLPQIKETVESFNLGFGNKNDISISLKHWSKNTFSTLQNGSSGQQIVNHQIVDDSDMMLAIFWTRFGTPTDEYGSGTEEEIERMLNAQKPVLLFFLDNPIAPSKIDISQYQRVKQFREKIEQQKKGYYSWIDNEATLPLKLRDQLELCFTDILAKRNQNAPNDMKISSSYDKDVRKQEAILWVDDRPENNTYGRRVFEECGMHVFLALSTNQALTWLEHNEASVIISDMGRKEGQFEGYVLLDELRRRGNRTPYLVFAGSRQPEHIRQVIEHGGHGCTNNFNELLSMVTKLMIDPHYRQPITSPD